MVSGAAALADTAVAQPFLDDLVRHLDIQYLVDLHTHGVQGLGLGQRPGEAVQDEAVFAVILGQPFLDDAVDHLVGDQAPLVDDGLGLHGGDVQALPDDLTLGALSRAGGS